jgi:hypothetical protein
LREGVPILIEKWRVGDIMSGIDLVQIKMKKKVKVDDVHE